MRYAMEGTGREDFPAEVMLVLRAEEFQKEEMP